MNLGLDPMNGWEPQEDEGQHERLSFWKTGSLSLGRGGCRQKVGKRGGFMEKWRPLPLWEATGLRLSRGSCCHPGLVGAGNWGWGGDTGQGGWQGGRLPGALAGQPMRGWGGGSQPVPAPSAPLLPHQEPDS